MDSVRKKLQVLNKKKSNKVNSLINKYDRTYYCVRTYWSLIEHALLEAMMKNETEISRAALVRRCIHERAMRTLGSEKYYKIINEPEKYIH